MNENEAINELKNTPLIRYEERVNGTSTLVDAIRMAIQALEEIQQYRAIGTIEECSEAVKYMHYDCDNCTHGDGVYGLASGECQSCIVGKKPSNWKGKDWSEE